MVTTNWATAQLGDSIKARPIGTYVVGQSLTGPGIRTFRYSTDMSINPHVYDNVSDTGGHPQTTNSGAHILNATEVHFIGEIWCSVLWDMTWNIINQVGIIEPNIYNSTGNGAT